MISTAIIYALIAMFAFGISNVMMKTVADRFGPVRGLVLRNLVTVPALAIALLILHPTIDLSHGSIFFAVILAIAGYFPFMFFVHGLELGKVGVIVPVSSGRIIVSVIVGFLFLGEPFTILKLAAISIVFVGIVLASIDFTDFTHSNFFSWKSGIPFALLAALLWGIVYPLFQFPSQQFGALFYGLVIESAVLAGGLVHLMLIKKTIIPATPEEASFLKKHLVPIIVTGLTIGVATVSANFGLATGIVSLVSAIVGASVVVSLIVASIMFRERLTLQQYAGAVCVVIGIAVAAFG
jgi:transporter family protein